MDPILYTETRDWGLYMIVKGTFRLGRCTRGMDKLA
jgi:hypothetical protein